MSHAIPIELRFEVRKTHAYYSALKPLSSAQAKFVRQVRSLNFVINTIRVDAIYYINTYVLVKGTLRSRFTKDYIETQIDRMNRDPSIWKSVKTTPEVQSNQIKYHLTRISLSWPDEMGSRRSHRYYSSREDTHSAPEEDPLETAEKDCEDNLAYCNNKIKEIMKENDDLKKKVFEFMKHNEKAKSPTATHEGPSIHPPQFHPKVVSPVSEELTDRTKHLKKLAEDAEKQVSDLKEYIINHNPSFLKDKRFWDDILKASVDLKRDSKEFKSSQTGKQSPTVIHEIRDQFNHSKDYLQELVLHVLKHQAAVSKAALIKATNEAAAKKSEAKIIQDMSKTERVAILPPRSYHTSSSYRPFWASYKPWWASTHRKRHSGSVATRKRYY